jgi:PAS domain S-box-containing protein
MSDARDAIVPEVLFDGFEAKFIHGQAVLRSAYPSYFKALDADRVIAADDAWYDSRTAELLDGYLAPSGIRAMLDAPIVREGRTVGVLCHEHAGSRRHWTVAEIGFSASMADLCAMVMEAAERHELQDVHRMLAAIVEATPDFVGTAGLDGRPTYINLAGRRLVGLAPHESLQGWSIDHLYTGEARNQRDEVSLPVALKRGVWSGESTFMDRYGRPFPVSQVLIAHRSGRGDVESFSTIARDLRPWKAIEASLRERERFLSTLLSNLPGVAYRRRNAPGWPMEYISQGCLELTGYSAERIMANDPCYNDVVHPDDHDRVYAEVDAAVAERRPFRVEYRIRRADGGEIWVWSMGRGVYDDEGGLVAREGFIGDITQRVLARLELERLNAELEARVADRTARLKEANQNLESFAYSVSHDLKAPLRGIDGYSRLLLDDYKDRLPAEAQNFLTNIREASERMNQLIDDLLGYSRIERRDLERASMALVGLVDRVLAEREIELKACGAKVDADVGFHTITGDGDALLLALRNLIDNAIKFSRGGQPPRLRIQAQAKGEKVIVSVADNGCGFDMKYHDRIFDIFQRLHRVEDYPGTGVGLAIVRKAVERMGGRVWAESRPGAGATFFLELPQ